MSEEAEETIFYELFVSALQQFYTPLEAPSRKCGIWKKGKPPQPPWLHKLFRKEAKPSGIACRQKVEQNGSKAFCLRKRECGVSPQIVFAQVLSALASSSVLITWESKPLCGVAVPTASNRSHRRFCKRRKLQILSCRVIANRKVLF